MRKKIIVIGLLPDVADYSQFPGLTKEKVSLGIRAAEEKLHDLGFDVKVCLVDRGETAESVVRAALQEKQYDGVLIGAGVRKPPVYFALFEKLVNVVHESAPKARICFNTSPDDTVEAVLRWVTPV
jgi:DNA-binding LacI/PurR family transcriptional regulator